MTKLKVVKSPPIIDLDFETRSMVDLLKVGAYNYAIHPSTEIQLMSYSIDGGPVKLVHYKPNGTRKLPKDLKDAIKAGGIIRAWNASFEALIWEYVGVPRMRWPILDISRFIDAMAVASRFGYPLSLDKAGKALGLSEDKKKIAHGKRLIRIFAVPSKKTGKYIEPEDKPEDFKAYKLYNKGDVITQQEVLKKLPSASLQEQEQRIWELDYKINNRGIKVDLYQCIAAVRTEFRVKEKLLIELAEITNGKVTTAGQLKRILDWMAEEHDVHLDNMQEQTLIDILKTDLPQDVRRVIEIRQSCGRASTGKYKKILESVNYDDHRVRGLFQFNGASRTSRWSGRGVQPHSFPRGKVKVKDEDIPLIYEGEIEELECEIGPYQNVLSAAIRQTFIAEKNHKFLVVDYSGIENRVLSWLTESQRLIQKFIDKIDQYKEMASKMYHKPESAINDAERFLGKQIVLGAGYAMGGRTFSMRMEDFGIILPLDVAEFYIQTYREENPEIVKLWYGIGDAAIKAVRTGKGQYKKIRFQYAKGNLYVRLPNNKLLCYPRVKLSTNDWNKPEITYMEQFYGRWGRTSTYGAKIVENICQAISRELLAESMLRLEDNGYPIVLHVHDEVVSEVKTKGSLNLTEMGEIMCEETYWNKGLPLEVEGFECYRYKK